MANWGKCVFDDLKKFRERLEQLEKGQRDRFYEDAIKELAARFLTLVKKGTPVQHGSLRNAWTVEPIVRKGNSLVAVISNSLEYASYVEFGHRQQPGRFIPGEWKGPRLFEYDPNAKTGMVLQKAWVPGKHMMTIAQQDLEKMAPGLLQKKLERFLREAINGYGE